MAAGTAAVARMHSGHLEAIRRLHEVEICLWRARTAQEDILVAITEDDRMIAVHDQQALHKAAWAALAAAGEFEKDRLDGVRAAWLRLEQAGGEVAALVVNGNPDAGRRLSQGPARQRFEQTLSALAELSNRERAESAAEYNASIARAEHARWSLLGLALLGGVVGLAFGYWVAAMIVRPIQQLLEGFDGLRRGDLKSEVRIEADDELGMLGDSYNEMLESLRGVMTDIQSAASRTFEAVGAVSAAAGLANTRHEATIEHTAATMQQISTTAEESSTLAQKAAHEVAAAQASSAGGCEAARRLNESVAGIEELSRRIASTIHVMDEIAMQTNLLALNAAVEAAHSGDDGMGFAVVASEVRLLAQRSAEAARDITGLIQTSLDQAAAGRELAERSRESLEAIEANVTSVSDLIRRIAEGSDGQRQAVRDVNEAVTQIDRTLQHNAIDVRHLTEVVSYFRIE